MAPLLLPLQGLTAQGLADAAAGHCSLAEARKVLSAVHRRGEALPARLDGCTNAALAAVRSAVAVPRLKLLARSASRVDPFVKARRAPPGGGWDHPPSIHPPACYSLLSSLSSSSCHSFPPVPV